MSTHDFGAVKTKLGLAGVTGRILVMGVLGLSAMASPAEAQPTDLTNASTPVPAAAPVGHPVMTWDETRFAVALEGRTLWLQDDAAKRLAGANELTGNGLSVMADVYRPTERLTLRIDATWMSTTANVYQIGSPLSASWKTDLAGLGASVRYRVARWLAPFVHVSGGVGWDRLTMHASVANLKDHRMFAYGTAGAGIELRTPCLRFRENMPWLRVGLVGYIEGGYLLAGGTDLSLSSTSSAIAQAPIPTGQVALGHVGHSAPYLRGSLGIAF
jgi:hypothetical protein